jgi:hypothetical protein
MPDRLALVIANYEFDDPKFTRLETPRQDAEALVQVLGSPEIGGFVTIPLINETQRVVSRQIARLYQKRKRDDLLLLYYSGHGVKDEYGDLYLAVKDSESETLSASSIEAGFIRRQIDKSQSRRNVVILDCCFSGAFGAGGAKSILGSNPGLEEVLAGSGYGRVVLTASNSVEYAWEGDQLLGEGRQSVFTRHLVEGLESGAADLNQDGYITLDELYVYVYNRVISSGESRQTPQKWAQQVEGQIVIALNPQTSSGATRQPPGPRLSVRLSHQPEQPRAGESVRWTVSMTNNSPEELSEVEVRYRQELLREPFGLLPGRWRFMAFSREYPEAGEYEESVDVSAIAESGRRVYYEAGKSITIQQPLRESGG